MALREAAAGTPGQDPTGRLPQRRDLALPIAAAAAAVALAECRGGIWLFDEGSVLYASHSLVRGEVLYEQVRMNYGPGILWLTAALFRLLGEDVLWPRLATVASFVALVLSTRGTLRAAGAARMADVAALSLAGIRAFFHPYWVMTSYTSWAVLLALGTVQATLVGRPLAAGLLAGLALVFKQNVGGIALVVALAGAALLAPGRRPGTAARVLAGFLVPVAAMLAALQATGSLQGYLDLAVKDNFLIGAYWAIPYPAFLPSETIRGGLFTWLPGRAFSLLLDRPDVAATLSGALVLAVRLVFLLPPLATLVALGGALRGGGDRARRLVLPLASAAMFLAVWPSVTVVHWSTPMLFSLLAVAAWAEGVRRRERAVGGLLAISALAGIVLVHANLRRDRHAVWTPSGTFFVDRVAAERISATLATLDDVLPQDAPLLVLPYAPFYYFASGHENPTDHDMLTLPWTRPPMIEEVARTIEERRLACILWVRSELPTVQRFESYARPIVDVVTSSFHRAMGGGEEQVWIRKGATARWPEPLPRSAREDRSRAAIAMAAATALLLGWPLLSALADTLRPSDAPPARPWQPVRGGRTRRRSLRSAVDGTELRV